MAQAKLDTFPTLFTELPLLLNIAVDLKEMKRNILAVKGFFV